MSEASPTRAAVLELKDEQRAMHEGYVFLDEKCLLLAGEILPMPPCRACHAAHR